MKRLILLLPFLAACGTPQEQCIRQVTRDQRVVERLIAESEETLRRGYAIETYETTVTRCLFIDPKTTRIDMELPLGVGIIAFIASAGIASLAPLFFLLLRLSPK